jgi:PAS domain-containing protein
VPQSELADLIDLIYAAALAEGTTWPEVARHIFTLTGAQQASLILPAANGTERNVFLEPGTYDERVRHYYRDIFPWRVAAGSSIREDRAPVGRVVRGEDIVPDREFLDSEFYNDYGRHAGFRHMIGGLLSTETAVSIAFTRDAAAGPFEEHDRHVLQLLMPHLQRAIQLRNRFEPDASKLGAGALDALSIAVIVVDGTLRVKHANAAAVALTNGHCGMTVSRTGPDRARPEPGKHATFGTPPRRSFKIEPTRCRSGKRRFRMCAKDAQHARRTCEPSLARRPRLSSDDAFPFRPRDRLSHPARHRNDRCAPFEPPFVATPWPDVRLVWAHKSRDGSCAFVWRRRDHRGRCKDQACIARDSPKPGQGHFAQDQHKQPA